MNIIAIIKAWIIGEVQSVEKIVGNFTNTVKALEQHAASKVTEALEHNAVADAARALEAAAVKEASTAQQVAAQIKAVVAAPAVAPQA